MSFPSVALQFRDGRAAPRTLPMNTFVERYIAGTIDIDGDLQELLRCRDRWVDYRFTWEQAKFLFTSFLPSVLVHSRAADRSFVVRNYDRGDDFFAAFLGESMVYSCGVFAGPDETLEAAQLRKIGLVAQGLQVRRGERLLDIGCGWGTLAASLANDFGANVTGVTLSANQTRFANELIRSRGLQDVARVLQRDYRDMPGPCYDKISCVEMAEHVGVRNFQNFLRQVRRLLTDDGLFFLQIVALRRPPDPGMFRSQRSGYWDAADFNWAMFMSKYIFPGADASLPLSFVASQMERAGFEIRTVANINAHYIITIQRWYQNWMRNREAVIARYGERWYRLWHLFLAWSTVVSEQGRGDCLQIVVHKGLRGFDRARVSGLAGCAG